MTALLPGQAAAPAGAADLSMMYVLHHGFRRDLARFAAAAQRTPADDGEVWKALLRRWDLFADLLHDHHHKEDEILWPYLRDRATRVGDEASLAVLDEMEAEHELIDPLLEQARQQLALWASGGDAVPRKELVALLTNAGDTLGDHLSHEERDAIAILQKYVAGEEWADLERRKFRGGLKPGVLLNLLPWATESLPPEVTTAMMAESGVMFRLMLRRGRPRFLRLERAAFVHVPAGIGA